MLKNKNFKILISDFDGTLFRTDKTVSKANLDAINAFKARGGIFAVCTGRMTAGIELVLKNLGYKGLFVSFNGAEIVDTEKGVLYSNKIKNDLLYKVTKFIEDRGVYVQAYPDNKLLISKYNENTEFYLSFNKVEFIVKNPIHEYIKESGVESAKILIFDDPEKIDGILGDLRGNFPELEVVRASDKMVEITNKGVLKSDGIKRLSEIYNVPVSEIIAMGDAGNDVSMLRAAGLGIAVGNASDEVKAASDLVVPSCDEDAVKYVIENYCI